MISNWNFDGVLPRNVGWSGHLLGSGGDMAEVHSCADALWATSDLCVGALWGSVDFPQDRFRLMRLE